MGISPEVAEVTACVDTVKIDVRGLQRELYQNVRCCLHAEFGEEVALLLHKWLVAYKANQVFLYEVNDLLNNTTTSECVDKDNAITYQRYDDNLLIVKQSETIVLPFAAAKRGVQLMVDALQDYLPLGSVVDLKKSPFANVIPEDSYDNLRIVITQRFTGIPETKVYFPYGGIVYPLGAPESGQMVYFTSPLIERTVHTGFDDEIEVAFVLSMKGALLFEKQYHSVAFSSLGERKTTQRALAHRREQQC
jgi:hypothetical protein